MRLAGVALALLTVAAPAYAYTPAATAVPTGVPTPTRIPTPTAVPTPRPTLPTTPTPVRTPVPTPTAAPTSTPGGRVTRYTITYSCAHPKPQCQTQDWRLELVLDTTTDVDVVVVPAQ